jgi:hypothetical protein
MIEKKKKLLEKLWHGYSLAALTLLSTLVAVVLINAMIYLVSTVKGHFAANPVSTKYGNTATAAVYPGLNEHEIDDLLKETWSRPYLFEPFTQFKERPHQGRYVNVDSNGFRVTKNQGPWPPQSSSLNIFLFGGSTTFGYGVADGQTISSYLQEHLAAVSHRDVRVYNFGRGFYYSTQERILFENLLSSGFVPDIAIFIDGLNDFYYTANEPMFTEQIRDFVEHGPKKDNDKTSRFLLSTSLGRSMASLFSKPSSTGKPAQPTEVNYNDPEVIDTVIKRYLANKKLIEGVAKDFGVKPLFVWQPVPTYHYDQQYHLFSAGGYGQHSYSQYGYEHMAELIAKSPLGGNFVWCADMQKDLKEALYIDKLHYSASFSKQIADAIADQLYGIMPP